MNRFTDLDALIQAAGTDLGTSAWLTVHQGMVDTFAEATGDQQWIHVDTDRAATGPFGGTIAHGYLTLSLLPRFAADLIDIRVGTARLNYGLDKVRFPSPVKVGATIRAQAVIASVTPVNSGLQVAIDYVVEIQGGARPACVAHAITLVVL